jgi:hypothetical protein
VAHRPTPWVTGILLVLDHKVLLNPARVWRSALPFCWLAAVGVVWLGLY